MTKDFRGVVRRYATRGTMSRLSFWKKLAHHRQRQHARRWLARGDLDRQPFARPVTAWDVL